MSIQVISSYFKSVPLLTILGIGDDILENMATCSVVTTPTAPADLVEAYRDDEEFYGIGGQDDEDLHVSEHLPSSDSDEDELGGTDTESEVAPRAFDAQSDSDQVMITNMDDDRRLVRDHMRQGCGCSFDCYKQFTDDEVFQIRLQMQELERSQRDFVLLGKLQDLGKGADTSVSHSRKTSSKRQRVTYQYAYDHRIVCKSAFCFLHCIGEKKTQESSQAS